MKKYLVPLLLGLLLFAVALGVRLYKIDNSLTEWHGWRQSDTAAVGRFLIKDNFNFVRPRYYDLSNIQSGVDNPQGLRMVEFPLYNGIFAGLSHFVGIFGMDMWARITTVFFSLLSLGAIYYLLRKEFGLLEAFFGGLFFALAPYVVFYSRAVLPDMTAVSLTFISLVLLYRYTTGRWWNYIGAIIFFAAALLVKPTALPYGLAALYFIFNKQHAGLYKRFFLIIFFTLIVAVPVFVWRQYITAFPEGIPASSWLLTSVNTPQGLQSVWFRPAFFRWIFFERINALILGGYLTVFLILGAVTLSKKHMQAHLAILLSAFVYLFTFQGGNVQHDYYQIMITPALALAVGAGVGAFVKSKHIIMHSIRFLAVIILFGMSFFFSYFQVKGYYDENKDLLFIADAVRSLTQESDVIVTDTMGDTTLLYLADRQGYPAPYRELEILKTQGASYFVTRDSGYKEKLTGTYELILENDKVLIFAL